MILYTWIGNQPVLKTAVILGLILSFMACKGEKKDLTDADDETVYISNELLDENVEETYEITEENTSTEDQFSGLIEAPNSYKNYTRLNDSAEEFAKAAVWHAVNMVYPEPFENPVVEVLQSSSNGDQLSISMKISWSDRWTGSYIIQGTLLVNRDGSNGLFSITSKNLNAESLEFTYDETLSVKELPLL